MLRDSGERSARTRTGAVATTFVLAVAAGDLTLSPLVRFRVATIVMVLAGAAAVWSARRTSWRRPAPAVLLAFAVTTAFSTPLALLRAPEAGAGRAEVQGLVAGVAVALAVAALSRGHASGLTALRRGWALGLALSIAVGTAELVTDAHLWVGPGLAWAEDSRTIIAGAFRNPNDFAAVLAAMMSGTLALAASGRRPARARWPLIALVVLGAVGVVLTESRSGLATLLVVLVVHALFLLRPGSHPFGRRAGLVAAGVGAVAVTASFVVPALAAHNPVVRIVRATAEPGTARSDRLRLDLIRAALRYLGESDGLGTGAASFEVLLSRDPAAGVSTLTWLHNTFLELLLQYGVPAGVMLVLVGLTVALTAVRPRRIPARDVAVARAEALSALVVFVGLACASATVLTTPIWWLVLGQAVASAWWLHGVPPAHGRNGGRARTVDPIMGG